MGSYIQKIDEEEVRYASMPSWISGINGTFASAILEPGKYRVIFQHSGSMEPEYLHFYSKPIDFETLNVEDMDISGFPTYDFTSLNFEDVILPTWEEYPNTDGATYPIGFNISIDENFWDYGYNISIQTSKNQDLFDDYITPDLAFLWDETYNNYTDYTAAIQPGNAQKVPVKTDGNQDNDALIIGSYDKFDRVVVDLADASDRDAFKWQYYRQTSGWRDFDPLDEDFFDGTNSSTGSLNKSGTISWDPELLSRWYYQYEDINSSTLPDTDEQNYYLIRVLCTDSSASIANITSISLRKFVKINLYVVSQLAFNIGTPEKPVYYLASEQSDQNLNLASSYGQASFNQTSHTIDKNYFSNDSILYLYAKRLSQFDYNGSNDGDSPYAQLEKPLTFSVCVFQPEDNYKRIIDYNISDNIPTTHSNQLNLSALTSDMQESINIPDRLTLYLNITPRNMYDWTQFNVQFINASVISTNLILPAKYDIKSAGKYLGDYNNGQFSLPYTGVNMNASIEFGFITETVYLEFVIENTTNNAAIFKVFGGQFDYPLLTVLAAQSGTNWYLWGGIGGGVVVLVVVSVIYYKKKHPV